MLKKIRGKGGKSSDRRKLDTNLLINLELRFKDKISKKGEDVMSRLANFFLGIVLLFSSMSIGATTIEQLSPCLGNWNNTVESEVIEIKNVDLDQIVIEDYTLLVLFEGCLLPIVSLTHSNQGYTVVALRSSTRCPNGHFRVCYTCKGCREPTCGYCCTCGW